MRLRNLFLAFFCLFILCGSMFAFTGRLQAQMYSHYLSNTSTWFELEGIVQWPIPSCPYGGYNEKVFRYHVVDTTTAFGHQWYQIHEDLKDIQDCQGPQTITYHSSAPGYFLMREDSTGKIWYSFFGNSPILAYDFGPAYNIGDTITFNDGNSRMVVDSIDTVYLGNDARTRWWGGCVTFGSSNNYLPEYIIEGVGFSIGLKTHYWDACDPPSDTWRTTICWQQNGSQILIDTNEICGDPPHIPFVGTRESLSQHSLQWQNNSETISIDGPQILGDFRYQVFDVNGRVLIQGTSEANDIHLPGLSKGIYIMKAEFNGQQIIQKFLRY